MRSEPLLTAVHTSMSCALLVSRNIDKSFSSPTGQSIGCTQTKLSSMLSPTVVETWNRCWHADYWVLDDPSPPGTKDFAQIVTC